MRSVVPYTNNPLGGAGQGDTEQHGVVRMDGGVTPDLVHDQREPVPAARAHAQVDSDHGGGRRLLWLKIVLPVLVLGLAAAGYRTLVATRPTPLASPPTERTWTVTAQRVTPATVRPTLHLFGRLRATRPIDLRSGVAGFVRHRGATFEPGSVIRTGTLLMTLDDRDLRIVHDQAIARLSEAEARQRELAAVLAQERAMRAIDADLLVLAENRVQRRQSLQSRGVTSTDALEQAETEAKTARRSLAQRDGAIAVAEARLDQQTAAVAHARAALQQAETDLERAIIRAPATALVDDVVANRGSRLGVNSPIATLLPLDGLQAEFRLSAAEYGRLTGDDQPLLGRPVRLTWQAGDGAELTGRIVRIDPRVDMAGGGILAHATLDGLGPDTPLRPGAFLTVVVEDIAFENVVRVPASTVMPDGAVYGIDDDRRLVPYAATVVRRLGSDVLVRTAAPPGTCLVTTRFNQIASGVKIETDGCGLAPEAQSGKTS